MTGLLSKCGRSVSNNFVEASGRRDELADSAGCDPLPVYVGVRDFGCTVGCTHASGATSSVSDLLRDSAHVRQARSRCLRCCPRVAVVSLSRPLHRERSGHEPLRPELAAPLGVCPLSQLTQGVGRSSCLLLSGGVAVLCCCIGSPPVLLLYRRGARAGSPTFRFQAVHIPSRRGSCERYALPPVAAGSRWPCSPSPNSPWRPDRALPSPKPLPSNLPAAVNTPTVGPATLPSACSRPVTKLLASPVTVWNRRRCLRLAQRGQCPSDKPVGDHGGSLACPLGVSPIRGRHESGMKSSNS